MVGEAWRWVSPFWHGMGHSLSMLSALARLEGGGPTGRALKTLPSGGLSRAPPAERVQSSTLAAVPPRSRVSIITSQLVGTGSQPPLGPEPDVCSKAPWEWAQTTAECERLLGTPVRQSKAEFGNLIS